MQTAGKNRAFRYVSISAAALAAMGVGYVVRDAAAQGQVARAGVARVYTAAEPAVTGPAVQSAVAMQTAFAEVARVAEPAVVTITTEARAGSRRAGGPPSMRRVPPGQNPFGDQDPFGEFEEFFRRFRERGGGGGGGGPLQPNSFRTPQQYDDGLRMTQGIPAPSPGSPFQTVGVGSGFIYDASGLIITNAHVVAGADKVNVKLLDGREFKDAKVLGSDTRTDIAVVKIPAGNLPTVRFGDASKVNVGDWAIAVGNPFGLANTMTVGVISAKGREMRGGNAYDPGDFLQTDASINPGNSGGPLLDIYGRVIGVNNSIYSRNGGNVGIGFAIPVNVAREVADVLTREGRVRRARIGVGIDEAEGQAAAFGLPAGTKGVLVQSVEEGGPSARAGIQVGDVITAFNGEPVTRSAELQRLVSRSPFGKVATITVLRQGKTLTLNITPVELQEEGGGAAGRRPSPAQPDGEKPQQEGKATPLGFRLGAVTPSLAQQFNLPAGASGALVLGVTENSAAARAGMQAGDLIRRVGQKTVTTPDEVTAAVRDILASQPGGSDGKSVALYVTRGSESQYVIVTVTE